MNRRTGEVFARAARPAVALGLLLTGCSQPEIDQTKPARVVSLWYDDEDVTFAQICVSFDKDGLCNGYTLVPLVDPESWNVTLRQCAGGPGPREGGEGCIAESFQIQEEEFARLALHDVAQFIGDELVRVPQ